MEDGIIIKIDLSWIFDKLGKLDSEIKIDSYLNKVTIQLLRGLTPTNIFNSIYT